MSRRVPETVVSETALSSSAASCFISFTDQLSSRWRIMSAFGLAFQGEGSLRLLPVACPHRRRGRRAQQNTRRLINQEANL